MKRQTQKSKYRAEYCALKNAIDRCTRSTHAQWNDYGGRGVTVDPELMCPSTGFMTFMAIVGEKPDPSFTLERKDNSLGYTRGNIAWVSRSENQRNRRPQSAKARDLGWGVGMYRFVRSDGKPQAHASPLVTLGDRTQTIKDWSLELGVAASTLTQRIQRGWTPEQALTSTIYAPSKAPKPNA